MKKAIIFLSIATLMFLVGCTKTLKYSTIFEAAKNGDLEDVKNHLRRGTAVNAKDNNGATALMVAAFEGHTATATVLRQ